MAFIKLDGFWNEGYAFDLYTTESVYVEDDAFGNPRFKNTYSEIGDLLYHFKYNGHIDSRHQIADLVLPFLKRWLKDKPLDIVMPCPSSLVRAVQPVHAVAYEIAKRLNIYYTDEVLQKTSDVPIKNIPKQERNLTGKIVQIKPAKRKCSILLIDDIVDTGATASECVQVLRNDPNIEHIYFFALAKKRVQYSEETPMKIFIAGARSIASTDSYICEKLESICERKHQIIIGDCYGVDAIVQQYLANKSYKDVTVYASNGKARNNVGRWNVNNVYVSPATPKHAFYRQKDISMAQDADFGFMIWDGISKGTAQNILTLAQQGKKVLVYNPNVQTQTIIHNMIEAQKLISQE